MGLKQLAVCLYLFSMAVKPYHRLRAYNQQICPLWQRQRPDTEIKASACLAPSGASREDLQHALTSGHCPQSSFFLACERSSPVLPSAHGLPLWGSVCLFHFRRMPLHRFRTSVIRDDLQLLGALLYLSSTRETDLLLSLELCWQPASPSNPPVSFHPQQHWDWKHAHSHIWFQKRMLSIWIQITMLGEQSLLCRLPWPSRPIS